MFGVVAGIKYIYVWDQVLCAWPTKFIMDIKIIYILYLVMFEPNSSAKYYLGCDRLKKKKRLDGNVERMGRGKRNACVVAVGKATKKRPLKRSRCTWKDNIKCVLTCLSPT
jgi:hypothetical protein